MRKQMTLCELSEVLINKNKEKEEEEQFADIFNGDIESDCLIISENRGNWANLDASEVVEFTIIKLDQESRHLKTIIEIDDLELN
jgi:hypothetical protein